MLVVVNGFLVMTASCEQDAEVIMGFYVMGIYLQSGLIVIGGLCYPPDPRSAAVSACPGVTAIRPVHHPIGHAMARTR